MYACMYVCMYVHAYTGSAYVHIYITYRFLFVCLRFTNKLCELRTSFNYTTQNHFLHMKISYVHTYLHVFLVTCSNLHKFEKLI